ncbi:uncharacterized protein LOC127639475 [Xyrauchen texanus]|uniref:uncharacterized protein LOC127639475 n=1 Tax=Xyrauchen texanus TaxID=154827 RepID=UPI002241F9E2|nr:uncharacterized protein LOC127639475 [Xyrauchen texanus]
MFQAFVICLCLWRLFGVFGEIKSVSVMEGESVTLHNEMTEIQINDHILWRFRPEEILLASMRKMDRNIFKYHAVCVVGYNVDDVRFKYRKQVNEKTGSLTITNITTEHSGLYQLDIRSKVGKISHSFNVTVYARLPVPVITSNSSQCSSSCKCVLVCSVVNVTHVTLSWYKGNSLLSSISVSDLNSSLSLPLEVEYQENNIYSCVINNPIRNQTKHLNITEVCQMCSDCVFCCNTVEAVIRLVISALVGVATVVILVYELRSRKVFEPYNGRFFWPGIHGDVHKWCA